jgi:4-O-beta-D-mannosyl-D-glucose phosphorylase
MDRKYFEKRIKEVEKNHQKVISRKNKKRFSINGVFERYTYPALMREDIPLNWRFDYSFERNPKFLERIRVNAIMNAGGIFWNGKYLLVARIEGNDRKSYFAVAESDNGVDGFKFRGCPIKLSKVEEIDTNVYDMRLTLHEDGWVYGLFCSERKDFSVNDTSSAVAKCGIVRTKDFNTFERLPDLVSENQQRNVTLHPEFVNGKYMLYTRPSDGFIDVGSGGGIGVAFVDSMENAVLKDEVIIDKRVYHTVKEVKNGEGATPIKTPDGWLHIAHGVRNHATGLRYVLYCFMTSLEDPTKVIYEPGGYFLAPKGKERDGDVSGCIFSNGAIVNEKGEIFVYYASSDTRLQVISTTIDKMVDYCKNTPRDGGNTHTSVDNILELIENNKDFFEEK